MATVELRPIFEFTCDDCGRDAFVRGVPVPAAAIASGLLPEDLDPDEVLAAAEDLVLAPEWVRCPHCGSRFKAVPI